jgi:hypothetical protein
MSVQPSPTSTEQSHQIRSASGPLTAALDLAREFPHLPATSLSATSREVTVHLSDADADSFPLWVAALELEEWKPVSYEHEGKSRQFRMASGDYAEVRVYVQAYAQAAESAVAA